MEADPIREHELMMTRRQFFGRARLGLERLHWRACWDRLSRQVRTKERLIIGLGQNE